MADEQDESSKTEEASERKLERAREEGNVPLSQEVKSWFMLFAALMMLWGLAPYVMKKTTALSLKFIERPSELPVDPLGLRDLLQETSLELFIVLLLPLGLFMILAAASAFVQIGFLYAPKRMEIKWERVNLFANAKEFITKAKIVDMIKGIFKIAAVGYAAWLIVKPRILDILNTSAFDTASVLALLYKLLLLILLTMVMIIFVIAFADYFYQKFSYLKRQRMTKQEVKDEYKQMEGDPQIKMRLRSIRMDRLRKRMMANVPKASVVVMNPTHFAVALRYEPEEGMEEPVVVAKGQDFIALKIKEVAAANDVPIVENPPLARALYASVEIDSPIPTEHYAAVAEVIKYVYRLKGKSLPQQEEN
ncbi:MAG: flagellar biosynthesis protein FlhB [Alphaproteobacteria bacterium]|nr:flagellar biosynthesis protein FlhB [Alphaproteobacteria bacterium]